MYSSSRHALLAALSCLILLSLTSCGGGGNDGGAPIPVAAANQTVVSGTVQAPGGAIAFFKEPSIGDFFTSEAYAALTGLANVDNGTLVQLARLNSTASAFIVIATTTVSGGLYSFNLTSLGLQPSNDLIVRVEGPGGKAMRAFVVGTVADINPTSETTCRLVEEALAGRPLTNLTLQEVADITGAVGLISQLQNIGTATSIDQAVGLVKTAVAANTQVTGFIASAASTAGQTLQGAGDIGNFYPFEQGSFWRYKGTRMVSGPVVDYENAATISGQGPAPGHVVSSTIFTETNDDGEGRSQNAYGVKGPSGITSYGNDDPTDNITRQLTPYQAVHFPLTIGTTTLLEERNGLDWGSDEDFDGHNESFSLRLFQTPLALEPMTVTAGTFPTTIRVETRAVFIVNFTRGRRATLIQTNTAWLAPGVGAIKEIIEARLEGGPVQATLTEELTSYVVNGQGGGLRIEVTPISSLVALGGTIQLTAQVFDNVSSISGASVTWSSSDGSVVSVDGTGRATGQNLGQASVRAAVGSIISNLVPVTVQDIRAINLETSDLIYDRSRQRIYASVPSHAGVNPDRILVINPETAAVMQTISVGDDPGKLAISDDFQYLYVAVKAPTASVVRINLSTSQVDLSFSVGTNIISGQLRVEDMEVIPGSPQSLVVARMYTGYSPRHAGVAVFDNGVQRPDVGPLGESKNLLEFGATPSRLYGADRESFPNTMSIMNIGPSGLTLVDTGCCSFDGLFDTGFIYSKDGKIIDPELKRIVGFLPGTSQFDNSNDNLITTDRARARIYLLKGINDLERQLLAYDRTSSALIGSASLSSTFTNITGQASSLILWGTDGLAFRTSGDNRLVLLRTSILQ
ncbi:MAG: Ig-like domain-containing protein [Nitrospira sp.]|nr:Ig-like domain-containing protein [Nitrospira sp.]